MEVKDPAEIVEQRDFVNHLVNHLIDRGFGEMIQAMKDPRFFAQAGSGAGQFSLTVFARCHGITHRRATKMLRDLQTAAAQLVGDTTLTTSPSPSSLRIDGQTTAPSAPSFTRLCAA